MPTITAAAAASTDAVMVALLLAETVMLPWPPVPSLTLGARLPEAETLLSVIRASTPPRMVLTPNAPPPDTPRFLLCSVLSSTATAVAATFAVMAAVLEAATLTSPALAVTSPARSRPASSTTSRMVLRAKLAATEIVRVVVAVPVPPVLPVLPVLPEVLLPPVVPDVSGML